MAGRQEQAQRHFRLMPEWLGQSGLWIREPGDDVFDAIGVEEAGFSEELADRLEDWMDEFDSIYDEADPASSAFASVADFARWRAEGERLAAALGAELRPGDTLDVRLPETLGPRP